MSELNPPLIQNYSSYRVFMRDSYNYKRQLRKGFSFRRFSAMSGLKSPNFLQMVMDGKRNLSPQVALSVAKVLGLNVAEKQYFIGLVRKESAKSDEDKDAAHREMIAALRKMLVKYIPQAQSEVLTHWYYMIVRELVFLKDFQADPEWIVKKLRGLITIEQSENALRLLLKSGFLRKENEKFVAVDPVVDTREESYQGRILNCHLETLNLWSKLIPLVDTHDRELGLINIPINKDKIPELKNRIRQFQDEIIGWVQDEKEADAIVQLGTYLVPISRL